MTATPPPGQPRAGSSPTGRQGNGVRSDGYPSPSSADVPEDINAYDSELVTSPGHGAVGVFQAPQPVRPRGNGGAPVDSTMDIDSPFLDLFGGTAAPAEGPSSPADVPDNDAEFDFGFDFDGLEVPVAREVGAWIGLTLAAIATAAAIPRRGQPRS